MMKIIRLIVNLIVMLLIPLWGLPWGFYVVFISQRVLVEDLMDYWIWE